MNHEPDPELRSCSKCGRTYDLAAQPYVDSRCPSCVADETPERTWPSCFRCQSRVPPDEVRTERVRNPGIGTESLPVCPDCADARPDCRE